jgi:hypothetical protein
MKTPIAVHTFSSALVWLLFFAGCGGTEVLSHRLPQGGLVETLPSSWSGVTPLSSKNHYFLSVAHDADALYLRMSITQESTQRQLMRSGLVLWVDPEGGSAKTFGIHYPLEREQGIAGEREFELPAAEVGGRGTSTSWRGGLEMEILGPDGKNKERMLISQGEGIRVNLERSPEEFTYTARIPFARFPELAEAAKSSGDHALGLGIELTPPSAGGRKPGVAMRGEGRGGRRGERIGGESAVATPDGEGMQADGMGGEPGGQGMRQRQGEGLMRSDAFSDWYKVVLKN